MPPPNPQPNLPAEQAFTDIELLWLDEQPGGLFPDNQNSNYGFLRRVISDELEEARVQLDELFNEMFPESASAYLSLWEADFGLPNGSGVLTDAQRRTQILSRLLQAPFTNTRRRNLVERFITDTFGTPAAFTASGISLAGGIPLRAAAGAVSSLYRIYENVKTYSYAVWILNTVNPDITSLTRELTWMTPSGITFTVDNTQTNILRYSSEILNDQPELYYRMGTLADASGNAGGGLTAAGGVVVGSAASPGLLANATVAGTEGATTFDGVDDGFNATAPATMVSPQKVTYEAWVKFNALPGAGANAIVLSKNSRYIGVVNSPPLRWVFTLSIDGVQTYLYAQPSSAIAVGTTYHIVGTFDGKTMRLYANGVLCGSLVVAGAGVIGADSSTIRIGNYTGTGSWVNGVIDEAASYSQALSLDRIQRHYNTGRNIA